MAVKSLSRILDKHLPEYETPKRADMWKGLIKKGKKVLTRASKSDKMFKRSKEERKTNLEN